MLRVSTLLLAVTATLALPLPSRATLYESHNGIDIPLGGENPRYSSYFNIGEISGDLLWAEVEFTVKGTPRAVTVTVGGQQFGVTGVREDRLLFGGFLTGNALDDLARDGMVQYVLEFAYTEPACTVEYALLTAGSDGTGPAQRIPEGGTTFGMLTFALAGLAFARRKRQVH